MNEEAGYLVHTRRVDPGLDATDLVPNTFLFRDTLQGESDVAGAWAYWQKANGTRTGGNNAGVSAPYRNGTGSVPAAFETDSYGGAARGPGVVEPDDPDCLFITNNFYLYQGAYLPAVERVDGYHAEVKLTDYRYRNMLALLDSYQKEGRTIGTPERSRSCSRHPSRRSTGAPPSTPSSRTRMRARSPWQKRISRTGSWMHRLRTSRTSTSTRSSSGPPRGEELAAHFPTKVGRQLPRPEGQGFLLHPPIIEVRLQALRRVPHLLPCHGSVLAEQTSWY
jgi:hypothetical protein